MAATNFSQNRHIDTSNRYEAADDQNYEDQTAFGDDLDLGGDVPREHQLKADFGPTVNQATINFAMDDQYLNEKWKKERVKNAARWFASTLGVLLASICFSLLGGYMFESMEKFNEIETCRSNREKYLKAMDSAKEAILSTASDFQITTKDRLLQYSQTLDTFISAFRNTTWRGDDCDNYQPRWDFLSSTFFCVTVITSIGYGWIAPVTFWGRLVLMAYAVIGLPMFLAALANMGAFLKDIVHYVYHNLCCCGTCKTTRINREHQNQLRQQMIALWRNEPNAPNEAFLAALEEDSGGDSSEEDAADEQAEIEHVPIPVTLLLLLTVFLFGGSVFSQSEGWSFLDATYFSFITVATIGFGDLVPGLVSTNTGKQSAFKIGLTWFFIIIGMTMLSTCLQMIQENAQDFVRNVMRKFSSSKRYHPIERDIKNDIKESSSSESFSEAEEEALPVRMTASFDQRYGPSNIMYPGPGNWNAMPPPPPMMMQPYPIMPPPIMIPEQSVVSLNLNSSAAAGTSFADGTSVARPNHQTAAFRPVEMVPEKTQTQRLPPIEPRQTVESATPRKSSKTRKLSAPVQQRQPLPPIVQKPVVSQIIDDETEDEEEEEESNTPPPPLRPPVSDDEEED